MKKEELITIVASVIISNIMIAVSVYYAMTYHVDKEIADISMLRYETLVTKKAIDERFETAVWNSLMEVQRLADKKEEILNEFKENNDAGLDELGSLGDLR